MRGAPIFQTLRRVRDSYFAAFPRGSTPAGGFTACSGGVGQVISVHVPEFPKLVLWLNSSNGPERGLPFSVPSQPAAPEYTGWTEHAQNATTRPPDRRLYRSPNRAHHKSP